VTLPARDHRISLADAAAHTRRHRDAKLSPVSAHAFHGDQVLTLLRQAGCVALRAYHGRDADGAPTLVLVGVDESGADMAQGVLLEQGFPCPPFCAAANPLTA
jgi:hypothetical protein